MKKKENLLAKQVQKLPISQFSFILEDPCKASGFFSNPFDFHSSIDLLTKSSSSSNTYTAKRKLTPKQIKPKITYLSC